MNLSSTHVFLFLLTQREAFFMYRSIFHTELTALVKRLSTNCNQYPQMQDTLKNVEVGDYGEKYVTELLKNTFGHQLIVLSDMSIGSSQADCLVITPYFCAVLEVKNVKGNITLTQQPKQMLREIEGKTDIFQSPEVQLERLEIELSRLFQQHHIQLPIFSAIAFPFHTSIIKNESKQYPVLIGKEVLNYIHLLPRPRVCADPQKVKTILQKQCKPWQRFPLCEYYKVDPRFIKTGVECRACGTIPMIRINRTWKCASCDVTDQTAHVQALKDYYMLVNKYITTQQAMHFLHLRNRYEAIRILKSVSIQRIGQTKSSKYELTL